MHQRGKWKGRYQAKLQQQQTRPHGPQKHRNRAHPVRSYPAHGQRHRLPPHAREMHRARKHNPRLPDTHTSSQLDKQHRVQPSRQPHYQTESAPFRSRNRPVHSRKYVTVLAGCHAALPRSDSHSRSHPIATQPEQPRRREQSGFETHHEKAQKSAKSRQYEADRKLRAAKSQIPKREMIPHPIRVSHRSTPWPGPDHRRPCASSHFPKDQSEQIGASHHDPAHSG